MTLTEIEDYVNKLILDRVEKFRANGFVINISGNVTEHIHASEPTQSFDIGLKSIIVVIKDKFMDINDIKTQLEAVVDTIIKTDKNTMIVSDAEIRCTYDPTIGNDTVLSVDIRFANVDIK